MLERRGFLRGLVSIPLIGGGVTLIGRLSAPVPLTRCAAAPIMTGPYDRARYAWEAFSAAMREITADAHGWNVQGGQNTVSVGYMKADAPWCRPVAVYCVPMYPDRPESRGLVDRHREIAL